MELSLTLNKEFGSTNAYLLAVSYQEKFSSWLSSWKDKNKHFS